MQNQSFFHQTNPSIDSNNFHEGLKRQTNDSQKNLKTQIDNLENKINVAQLEDIIKERNNLIYELQLRRENEITLRALVEKKI